MTAFLGWLDANLGAQPVKRGDPANVAGAHVYELMTSITKKTTDGNGTVYFLAAMPADAVIISAELNCDALSGATSADLGFYDLNAALAPAPTAVNCGSGTGTIPTTAQVDAGATWRPRSASRAGLRGWAPSRRCSATSRRRPSRPSERPRMAF